MTHVCRGLLVCNAVLHHHGCLADQGSCDDPTSPDHAAAAVPVVPPVPTDRRQPFNPPQGQCHALSCDEPSTMLVQVWRERAQRWTHGIDFCEPHAHDFANRVEMAAKVTPL